MCTVEANLLNYLLNQASSYIKSSCCYMITWTSGPPDDTTMYRDTKSIAILLSILHKWQERLWLIMTDCRLVISVIRCRQWNRKQQSDRSRVVLMSVTRVPASWLHDATSQRLPAPSWRRHFFSQRHEERRWWRSSISTKYLKDWWQNKRQNISTDH